MTSRQLTVRPLDILRRDINFNHGCVLYAEREIHSAKARMLEAAARAGASLLEVKKQAKHGEFGKWVKENCTFTMRHAQRYMKWADKYDVNVAFEDQWEEWQGLNGNKSKPKPATPEHLKEWITPDRDDLERALKLSIVIEKGTKAEAGIARIKLNRFAETFGLSGEVMEAKARAEFPNHELTDDEAFVRQNEQRIKEANDRIEELERQIKERDEKLRQIRARYKDASRDQLIETIAELTLKLGE